VGDGRVAGRSALRRKGEKDKSVFRSGQASRRAPESFGAVRQSQHGRGRVKRPLFPHFSKMGKTKNRRNANGHFHWEKRSACPSENDRVFFFRRRQGHLLVCQTTRLDARGGGGVWFRFDGRRRVVVPLRRGSVRMVWPPGSPRPSRAAGDR